mgnify:CR=1 FL=1
MPPFVHLNLRRNPFGEFDRDERKALAVVELDDLTLHMDRPGKVAIQFLGPQGRGKSTHLLALHRLHEAAPYTQLYVDEEVEVPPGDVQFIDSFDLWPTRRRRRALRAVHRLACTTHVDLRPELQSMGFDVVTRRFGAASRTHLHGLVRSVMERRIEHCRRREGPVPHLDDVDVARLIALFGDDIRAMEHHLYDLFQALPGVCRVQV